ncbi:MAG TPA: hypothetical protein VEQ42_13170 [Pyrinomonadaceae bacterium]|nr:hypothetical protein [Pyrinomonadaceae bacterium]
MYKPNFCAECGERVERARWRPWTSGRFCAACEPRFRRRRFVAPAVVGCALLASGFAAGRLARPAPPPLVVSHAPDAPPPAPLPTPDANASSAPSSDSDPSNATAARYGPDGAPNERPTDPEELVSVCGARTKKGAPCSRRVRGTGRCWQHRGRPAMLPPSKLVVKD